jgi:hypothetical protein
VRSSRLRWNKWSISAAIVISVLGSRWVAHSIAEHTMPSAAPATRLFAETLVVTALFGVLLWRAVIVPVQRRHAMEQAALREAPVAAARVARTPTDDVSIDVRGRTTIGRGHLRLVPSPRHG